MGLDNPVRLATSARLTLRLRRISSSTVRSLRSRSNDGCAGPEVRAVVCPVGGPGGGSDTVTSGSLE